MAMASCRMAMAQADGNGFNLDIESAGRDLHTVRALGVAEILDIDRFRRAKFSISARKTAL